MLMQIQIIYKLFNTSNYKIEYLHKQLQNVYISKKNNANTDKNTVTQSTNDHQQHIQIQKS